ncbi:hypothetical protein LWC33_20945 [Pseudonocardia sp. RS11V-5]|uniref:hypothetical protein n=1 Tax=Pseudonocardia terrae TaxID=2905831 RepID=UPI001E29EE38|nr:hypothetical protein [Pseudonocardia terrae]MCE3553911.1 hypothetical protein [Pseudonocardia terrae]
MTATHPERPTADPAGVLPDDVVRGEVAEDPTIAIPVVPRQYVPVPPPHPRPVADPYGPPAGLGPVAPPPGYGALPYGAPMFGTPVAAGVPARSRKGVFFGGIAAGVAALGLVIGVATALSAASAMEVTGTFRLTDAGYGFGGYRSGSFTTGSVCSGSGGYSDIHAGTGVMIANASGAVIATGALSTGRASSSTTCDFAFTVPDVPAGEDFYQVTVSHRGTLTCTADELRSGLGLSLGD